jgi:hypothetical protein
MTRAVGARRAFLCGDETSRLLPAESPFCKSHGCDSLQKLLGPEGHSSAAAATLRVVADWRIGYAPNPPGEGWRMADSVFSAAWMDASAVIRRSADQSGGWIPTRHKRRIGIAGDDHSRRYVVHAQIPTSGLLALPEVFMPPPLDLLFDCAICHALCEEGTGVIPPELMLAGQFLKSLFQNTWVGFEKFLESAI